MPIEANPYDSRFAEYAEKFEAFARAHNLLVEKYYHDAPVWSFCFAHPRGGQAKLDLWINESGVITLQSVWWIDSYSDFTRSLKWGHTVTVASEPERVLAALDHELAVVATWRPGAWMQVADGYKAIWGAYSEDQFQAMTPQWPDPIF